MFRDNKVAIAMIFVLYAICGTLDGADQLARERGAGGVVLASNNETEK